MYTQNALSSLVGLVLPPTSVNGGSSNPQLSGEVQHGEKVSLGSASGASFSMSTSLISFGSPGNIPYYNNVIVISVSLCQASRK